MGEAPPNRSREAATEGEIVREEMLSNQPPPATQEGEREQRMSAQYKHLINLIDSLQPPPGVGEQRSPLLRTTRYHHSQYK